MCTYAVCIGVSMDSEHMVFLVFKVVFVSFCQSVCVVKSIMKDILGLAATTLQCGYITVCILVYILPY